MKKIIVTVVVLAIVGGGFVLYNNPLLLKKQPPATIEKITVAWADQPAFALMYIAQNKGYFTDEGLEVTYRKFTTGRDALADVIKGNSDIATVYEAPVVRQIYQGKDISIISTLHTSSKNGALIGRRDKNITRIEDIKNKKIGVTKGTADEFFLYSYLSSQGVRLSDVTLVNGEFKDMLSMLRDGKADAVVATNPYFYEIKKQFSQDKIVIFQSDVYTENSLLVGNTNEIKNKKETFTRLLKALVRAENLLHNNQEEAIKAVVGSLPTFSEESIRATWDQLTPELKLDNVLLTLLEREAGWFKDNKIYTGPVPDFRKAIFSDYLKATNPNAVTVY